MLFETVDSGRMKMLNVIASKVQAFDLAFVFDFHELFEVGDVVVFDAEML